MTPVVFAILVGISVYVAVIALLPKSLLKKPYNYTQNMLKRLERQNQPDTNNDDLSVLRRQSISTGTMARLFMVLPGAQRVYPMLLKAGMATQIGGFFIACIVVFVISFIALSRFGIFGIALAIAMPFLFGWRYIKRHITKRNNAFLFFFPDALDMIVRSVRSGYPLNSAVRMVADNMQAPVSTEFKQVADEVAYGSTLIEALHRLSLRIDEPDVRFFVVVLSVQQDIGGSLSEVLGNLSGIIRKRKYLRMKIKSLSSEGRASAWVLGSMPFVETLLILVVSPNHLTPLFTTPLGQMLLAGTVGVAFIGFVVLRQIVNIRV